MPLFRSHSNGDTSVSRRRSDFDRQIGCIAGFFQIFDPQLKAKQIAAPRKDAAAPQPPPPPPPAPAAAAETPSLSNSVPRVEDDANLKLRQSKDGKVVAAKSDDRALSDACVGDGELPGPDSIQSTNDSNHDSILLYPSHQEKLHRFNKAAAHVREGPPKAIMSRHSSFKDRENDDIAFSPRRGGVAAYAAGGRRFASKGSLHSQGSSFVDAVEDSRNIPREDEKWGHWSSPASHWPTRDGMQGESHDNATGGGRSPWIARGGRAAERHWAAEDSLEEWKQSLRALARLKDDEEAGVFSNSGIMAPKASPRAVRNELPPTSPARASAFDFKEVIRWSQQASSHAESSARRSWDDRDLPRSIAELRDAINARSRAIAFASPPPSPRPPSVVARLMGLDNLPQQQGPLLNNSDRKTSGEAKLLQQLLQCSPSTRPPLPPSSPVKAQQRKAVAHSETDYPLVTPQNRNMSRRSELQSMLKHVESMSLQGSNRALNAKPSNSMPRYVKPNENKEAEPRYLQPPLAKKSHKHNHLPVVVLKQSEEIRSPVSPRSSHGYHDEIEQRLRQLGLQSSEQERKTLKQILEAMQHKGLLKPPDGAKSSDGAGRRQALSPGSPVVSSSHTSPTYFNAEGAASFWPSDPPAGKPIAHSNLSTASNAKRSASASIVIMRPMAKSASRINTRNMGNGKAVAPSSRFEKVSLRNPKNSDKSENTIVKEMPRPKARPPSASPSAPASLHTSVQSRKLSLKIKQGQAHVSKGSARTTVGEQARKSKATLPKDYVKPVSSSVESELEKHTSDEANSAGDSSDSCIGEDVHNTSMQSECSSDGSLDDPLSQETVMEGEVGLATPPREYKVDCNSGEKEGCFAKEVEQCSPVSVLDMHLSDNEAVESPNFGEDNHIRDYQGDMNACHHLPVEVLPPSAIAQPFTEPFSTIVEMGPVEEAHVCNAKLINDNEDNQHAPQNSTELCMEDHRLDCDQSFDDATSVDEVFIRAKVASSASKECIQEAIRGSENGDCSLMNVYDYIQRDGACSPSNERNLDERARSMFVDASKDELLYDACESNGEEMDDVWMSNADFCYTEDVLRMAGVVVGPGVGWCAAEGWLAGGGEMGRALYDELEEQWDAVGDMEGCTEDRDMGGELYRKSQQAAMRRRLLFDCANEILEQHFSWVGMPGVSGGYRQMSAAVVWGELQRLEQGPCSAEDSMYAMLEQDLLNDVDYNMPYCWRGKPTEIASVSLHLEKDILDSLVMEALPHATHW